MCRVMVKTFLRIRLCLILPFYLTVALVEGRQILFYCRGGATMLHLVRRLAPGVGRGRCAVQSITHTPIGTLQPTMTHLPAIARRQKLKCLDTARHCGRFDHT